MRKRSKVVAHFRDGRTVKGYLLGLAPDEDAVYMVPPDPDSYGVAAVSISHLKAVFFVKSFDGDRHRLKSKALSKQALRKTVEPKVKVTFRDAEVLYGTTSEGYSKEKDFFLTPADKHNNNDMVYVVGDSTLSVASWS